MVNPPGERPSHLCPTYLYESRQSTYFDSMIHVCSLARLHETVEDTGARHVVSLIGDEARIERPIGIVPENHLWLKLHDISMPLDGYIIPEEAHVADLIDFVQRWDRRAPLVVHCFAGISRS